MGSAKRSVTPDPWSQLSTEDFPSVWRHEANKLEAKLLYGGPFGILQAGLLVLKALLFIRDARQHVAVITSSELQMLRAKRRGSVQVLTVPRRRMGPYDTTWNLYDQPVLVEAPEVLTEADFKHRFPKAKRGETNLGYPCGVVYYLDEQVVGHDCPTCGGVVLDLPDDFSHMQNIDLRCHRCGSPIEQAAELDDVF